MSTDYRPLVSVVMPCLNGAPFLREALASIRAQNWPELELLFVDDGSTDGSAEIVREMFPDVRHFAGPGRGPAVARNIALREARGEVVAFLDADDIWPGDKFAIQMPWMDPRHGLDMACGQMRRFRENPAGGGHEFLEPAFIFVLGCCTMRRGLLERTGLLDEKLPGGYGEDTDWFMRAWEAEAKIRFQKETTILYRRHATNMTNGEHAKRDGSFRAIAMSLARRKAAGGARPMPQLFRELQEGLPAEEPVA